MISKISIFKIFTVLILTLPVSFLVSGLIFTWIPIDQIWFSYILQFSITLIFLELGLWVFKEKSILKKVLPKFTLKRYFIGALVGFVFIILSQIYSIIFDQKLFFIANLGYIVVFGLVFLFQSFVEEIIYRKFLIDEFQVLFNGKNILSVIVAGFLFALVHLVSNTIPIDIFNLFLFGTFLGFVYIYIESRFPDRAIFWTSGFHFAWNLSYFLLGIQFINQSTPEQSLAPYQSMHILSNQTSFWANKIPITVILSLGIWWVLSRMELFKKIKSEL